MPGDEPEERRILFKVAHTPPQSAFFVKGHEDAALYLESRIFALDMGRFTRADVSLQRSARDFKQFPLRGFVKLAFIIVFRHFSLL